MVRQTQVNEEIVHQENLIQTTMESNAAELHHGDQEFKKILVNATQYCTTLGEIEKVNLPF